MQVPGSDAQWNACVKLIFGGIWWRAVHHTHELVAIAHFVVEQCAWVGQVKGCLSLAEVPYVGEMVDVLRYVWRENLEAVPQRQVVVLVLVKAHVRVLRNSFYARHIPRRHRSIRGHFHMRPHIHVSRGR